MARRLHLPLVCIVGPTASGKSELAELLAERMGAAILSADSMQIYRGMDIGTGKIPKQARQVDYYGIDLVDPGDAYSASLYQDYGRQVIQQLDERRSPCIVCGGTGFYIRSLVDDFDFPSGEQTGNVVREAYQSMLASEGAEAVWDALNAVDPASAQILPPADSKRVIRALELHDQGISYADQKERFGQIAPFYEPLCLFGLEVEPALLAERIDRRVEGMLEAGLLEEVSGLLEQGFRSALTASAAIGYKEFVSYYDGVLTLEEAVELVKRSTRQYAKRQRTWFRKDKRIVWLDANAIEKDADTLVEQMAGAIAAKGAE